MKKTNHKTQQRSLWVRILALAAVAAIVLTSGILAFAEEGEAADAETAETGEALEEVVTQVMYRLYNPNNHEHLYTAGVLERDTLVQNGWDYEGIAWYAPATSNTPVYRLFNKYAGEHHYTTDKNEYLTLIANGWNDEGIGWYSDDAETIPVYREFSPVLTTGTHNFTTDRYEHYVLTTQQGWEDENIAWYASIIGNPDVASTLPSNYIYLRGVDGGMTINVYNPAGHRTADKVSAMVWSEGHGWDDLTEYVGEYNGQYYQITIPNRPRMEKGTVQMILSADNGDVHTELGNFSYNISEVEWSGGWVYAHGQWYHYDASGNVNSVAERIPGYIWQTEAEEYTFISDAYSDARVQMLNIANEYTSPSNYIILVNRTTHTTGVYTGSKGNWKEHMYVTVSDGAPSTPTVEGKFKVGIKMRYFDSGVHRLFYATQFYYDYLFHSISYYQDPQPERILDGRLGVPISHGCVRMKLEDAKWIYDNIPAGTTVVVYH